MENKRTCGGCTACCLTHAILEIRKPAGKDCPFCKPNVGCNIYDNRPNGCLNFRCNWLRGDGDDLCRPDRTGVVFDSCTGGLLKKFLQIWEARPGAISTPEIWEATRIALESQGRIPENRRPGEQCGQIFYQEIN